MAKEATRGQKQINKENQESIQIFLWISVGSMTAYLLAVFTLFWDSYSTLVQFFTLLAALVYISCISTMKWMARTKFSETGTLIDAGIDLNMKEGFAEHLKDLVILTSVVQILSLASNYFWLLLLLAPGRAFHLLWKNVLSPWVFAPAPVVDDEKEEKKQRKLERKMRRMH